MSCHCKKPTCPKCNPNSIADIQAKLAEMSDTVSQLSKFTKFLSCGHPEMLITTPDDVASFDFTTGKGSGCWDGWALCTGKTFFSISKNKNIITPNFVDRFIVMAGGKYAVGDTGGQDAVTLSIAQMPTHNHGVNITDPGHNHAVTDPGHNHAVTDPGHNHAQQPHAHQYTDTSVKFPGTNGVPIVVGSSQIDFPVNTRTTVSTTAINNPSTTGISVNTNVTGVTNVTSATGITADTQNAGQGKDHENRPPYFAGVWVIYIG